MYMVSIVKSLSAFCPDFGISYRYRNISYTDFRNFNVSCLVLQLSLPNPLKPRVK